MSKKPPHNIKPLRFEAYQGAGWKERYTRCVIIEQRSPRHHVDINMTVPGSEYANLSVYLTNQETAELIAMLGKALARSEKYKELPQ